MKKLISCILALLLLTTAAFAVPGDSCVVLGEELTLGETDGIFTALGVERGTAMELALSRPDAETYFSDVPEKAASVGVFVRIRSGGEGLSLSLSNITGAETAMKLTSMRTLTLEECLEFIDDDELLEITPKSLRMRKRVLETELRKKLAAKKRAEANS